MKKIYKTPAIQVINLNVEDIMLTGSVSVKDSSETVEFSDAFDNRSPIWGDRK